MTLRNDARDLVTWRRLPACDSGDGRLPACDSGDGRREARPTFKSTIAHGHLDLLTLCRRWNNLTVAASVR